MALTQEALVASGDGVVVKCAIVILIPEGEHEPERTVAWGVFKVIEVLLEAIGAAGYEIFVSAVTPFIDTGCNFATGLVDDVEGIAKFMREWSACFHEDTDAPILAIKSGCGKGEVEVIPAQFQGVISETDGDAFSEIEAKEWFQMMELNGYREQ